MEMDGLTGVSPAPVEGVLSCADTPWTRPEEVVAQGRVSDMQKSEQQVDHAEHTSSVATASAVEIDAVPLAAAGREAAVLTLKEA